MSLAARKRRVPSTSTSRHGDDARVRIGSNWCVYANDQRVFALRIGVRVGAVHEPMHLSGLSHLLEHLLFKNKNTAKTRALRDDIADIGGTVNASTGKDTTVYEIAVPSAAHAKAIDIMRRIVFCLKIDTKQLELEKDIVLQEKKQTANGIEEVFIRSAFTGTAYEKTVIGTETSIRRTRLHELHAYTTSNEK